MEDQKQKVYDALDKQKIKYEVVEHEPVYTMEDMDRLGLPEKGTQEPVSAGRQGETAFPGDLRGEQEGGLKEPWTAAGSGQLKLCL